MDLVQIIGIHVNAPTCLTYIEQAFVCLDHPFEYSYIGKKHYFLSERLFSRLWCKKDI